MNWLSTSNPCNHPEVLASITLNSLKWTWDDMFCGTMFVGLLSSYGCSAVNVIVQNSDSEVFLLVRVRLFIPW